MQAELFSLLQDLDEWQGQLHLCQALPHLKVSPEERPRVETFVRRCIKSDNKFVRAWAYNALYELGRQYPELMDSVMPMLHSALQSETASVQARIRNIMKNFHKAKPT